MAVFRIERTRDYTVMSNHHLRNANLSLKAKGLLSMLSLIHISHESEITLRTQRAEKIGQHGAAFVFQNAAHERGAEGKALHKELSLIHI